MSEFEKGRESRPAERPGEKSVRDSVPVRRPPPAAGLFGKLCPAEPLPRRECRTLPTPAEFEARFVAAAIRHPTNRPNA